MKTMLLLLALTLGLGTATAQAADLTKVDPLFMSTLTQARADRVSPRTIKIEAFVAVSGNYSETQIRKIFAKAKVESRSVIPGDLTIVTASGTLAAFMKLTDHAAVIAVETSRVLDPEPSSSVGN